MANLLGASVVVLVLISHHTPVQSQECLPPCQNGGSCVGANICICRVNFEGSDCSRHVCTESFCLNGGTCTVSTVEGPVCRCVNGFTGTNCQLNGGDDIIDITDTNLVPSAPVSDILALAASSTSIAVRWREYIETNILILSYELHYEAVGDGTAPRRSGSAINITSGTFALIPGLAMNTLYSVSVRAFSRSGPGPYSENLTVSTLPESGENVPGGVSQLMGIPQFMSFLLTWNAPEEPNGVIISYEVTYRIDNQLMVTTNTTNLSTIFIISSLEQDSMVSAISVSAYTSAGRGPPQSVEFTGVLVPPKVESIEAEALSATSARVTWEPVDVAEVTGYLVYYRPLVAVRLDLEGEEKVPKTDSSVVIRNLMSNVEYWFEVAAVVEVNGRTLTGERTGANTTVLIERHGVSPALIIGVVATSIFIFVFVGSLVICLIVMKSKKRAAIGSKLEDQKNNVEADTTESIEDIGLTASKGVISVTDTTSPPQVSGDSSSRSFSTQVISSTQSSTKDSEQRESKGAQPIPAITVSQNWKLQSLSRSGSSSSSSSSSSSGNIIEIPSSTSDLQAERHNAVLQEDSQPKNRPQESDLQQANDSASSAARKISANSSSVTPHSIDSSGRHGDSSSADLKSAKVEGAIPVIEEFPKELETSLGCELLVQVKVRNASEYFWFHEGNPVDSSLEVKPDGSLFFPSVERGQRGLYELFARNPRGNVRAEFKLKVHYKIKKTLSWKGSNDVFLI